MNIFEIFASQIHIFKLAYLTRIFHTKSITACGKLYGYCVGLEW